MKRLLPAVVFLMVGSSAYAAPVLFDTREAFNAAIGEHALFTDFNLTHVPFTLDFEGDFGGLYLRKEVFELTMGATLGPNGVHSEGQGAGMGFTTSQPVRAIGFDVVSAFEATGPMFDPQNPFVRPDFVPTNVRFGFLTQTGERQERFVAPGSFVGALLYDDAFQFVSLTSRAQCVLCASGFLIDNLAVQAVPEPATVVLVSAGLVGVLMLRQFRRR